MPVCNYQKPVDGQPALLLWDDVITLFAGLAIRYMVVCRSALCHAFQVLNTPRDFVEFPLINEHWASHPRVFERYARHVGSGEKCPLIYGKECARRVYLIRYDMTELLGAAFAGYALALCLAEA